MDIINQKAAIERIYDSTLDAIMDAYNLINPQTVDYLKDYLPIAEKIAFGITHDFISNPTVKKQSVVIGGPCICYCQADIRKITLQDFMDILFPISFAAFINRPVVIFFQTYEAFVQQKGIDSFQSSELEWNQLFEELKKIALQIADHFHVSHEKIFIVSTSNPEIKNCMDEFLQNEKIKNVLTPDFLYGMYSINGHSLHPKGSCDEALFLDIYKRNLVTYLPSLIDFILHKENSSVIVVENCTQLKTSLKAQQLHEIAFANASSRVCHLAYISSPGLNGKEMYKCKSRNKMSSHMTMSELQGKLEHSLDYVKDYYYSLFHSAKNDTLLEAFELRSEKRI